MPDDTGQLDRLLSRLQQTLERRRPGADAIDRVLEGPRRHTEVRSLTDDKTVDAFRRELIDGFIRADTANRLLGLIDQVIASL